MGQKCILPYMIFQISDLLGHYNLGNQWIDREVEGKLAAVSNVVETESMHYLKVIHIS